MTEQDMKANGLDTFEKYIKNCMPEEYPDWVKDIMLTVFDGKTQRLQQYEDWVTEVYEEKKKVAKPAMSDGVR